MKDTGILTRLKQQLGASGPGVVVAVIALIVALTGGAFAATNQVASTSKTKVVKGPKGPKGAKGAQGPVGPQGPAGAKGDTGAQGPEGKQGKSGENGKDGEAGKSPVVVNEGPTVCEPNGGVVYEVEGVEAEICNGAEGSPWTAGGTLPPGATEGGVWNMNGEGYPINAPISFSVPLAEELTESQVHLAGEADFGTTCHGSASSHPAPPPGELCVYESVAEGVLEATHAPIIEQPGIGSKGANKSGALVVAELGPGGFWYGTYAVTGCTREAGKPSQCPSP
jgi:hypothetical protein